MICWTLGITEHHNAVDNVLSLINLALLTGHVGRWGSGLNPLRGQNNVQGGGDMGALPHKLPGFQDVEDPARARASSARGARHPAEEGLAPDRDVRGDGARRADRALRDRREPRAARPTGHAARCLGARLLLVVQDIFLTRTAELADVVLPAPRRGARRGHGHQQRAPRAARAPRRPPPRRARDDICGSSPSWRALGRDLGRPTPEELWDELRALSPMHAGMSYARLERSGGIQWPCPDESHPGPLPARPAVGEPLVGPRAPFSSCSTGPVDPLDAGVPAAPHHRPAARLVQHRRADGGLRSPLRAARRSTCPRGRGALGVSRRRARARALAPRGVVAPVRIDAGPAARAWCS
jgi:predicted molibdopterin-dependent oxidoreductase YjgC